MRNLTKLKTDLDVVYNGNIVDYLDVDYVYVPMKKNYKTLVKNNESVYKGEILLEDNLNKIVSPVSGKVMGMTTLNIDGNLGNAIVIENSFKEEEKKSRKYKDNKFDCDSIISKLYDFYFKYIASVLETKKINNLIISGFDDEPYIQNNAYVLKKYHKEILELADILATSFNIKRTSIVIKNNNAENVETFLARIGTYPNIFLELVEDRYLLGKPFFLLEYLNLKEIDSFVIDAKTMYEVYNALKYNKYTYETFITVAGPSLAKSMVLKVKIGTLFKDIIDNKIKIINKKPNLFILDGLMTGKPCQIEKTIVTKNTLGLIVVPNEEIKESKCINCGMCYKICPVKVNPKRVMDTGIKSSNCINCGLCSYICPCNINLRHFLEDNHE